MGVGENMRQGDAVNAFRRYMWKQQRMKLLELEMKKEERENGLERTSRDDH